METGISDKELTQIREQMLKFATLQVNNPVFVLETEIEDEEQTNHFFDEGGHWKAEHSPLDLEQSENAVYSEEFWLIFETCLTCLPAKQAKIFMMREFLELSSEVG